MAAKNMKIQRVQTVDSGFKWLQQFEALYIDERRTPHERQRLPDMQGKAVLHAIVGHKLSSSCSSEWSSAGAVTQIPESTHQQVSTGLDRRASCVPGDQPLQLHIGTRSFLSRVQERARLGLPVGGLYTEEGPGVSHNGETACV